MNAQVRFWVSGVSVAGAAIWLLVCWYLQKMDKVHLGPLFALWTVGHPIWFLYDWKRFTPTPQQSFEQFKYSQELARNLWLAVAVLLGILIGIK